jgi:hypothetical protein
MTDWATTETKRTRPGFLGVLPYLFDIVIPLVTYYVLKSFGASDFSALLAGGLLTSANTLMNTIRRGRLDSLGVLVVLELVVGIALDVTLRDPRLLLARGSFFVAVAGVWALATTFTSRPMTVDASKPMAAKGGPRRLAAFEWCARHHPVFLRVHRRLSLLWSLMFIAYAVLRVVIIYRAGSVGASIWLNEIPGIVGVAICLAASARAGKVLEKIVDRRVARMDRQARS